MPLTARELEHYREHGYVIPDHRLPAPLLGDLRTSLDGLLGTYRDVKQEDLANPHMLPPTEGSQANAFMQVARQPGILDMLEQILGPDLVLWIALDPVSTANGCMRFIPGSHKNQGTLRHHVTKRTDVVLNLELDSDQFDESKAVNVELEPGQMSLHDVRLVHGSLANTSGKRRAALIMRYMPATSHYDRSLVDTRRDNSPFNIYRQPLWLMRGVNRCNRNDFEEGHRQWHEQYARGLAPSMESEG